MEFEIFDSNDYGYMVQATDRYGELEITSVVRNDTGEELIDQMTREHYEEIFALVEYELEREQDCMDIYKHYRDAADDEVDYGY